MNTKAEKDLGLTWEDIKIILDIENDILRECNSQKELVINIYPKGEDYYGEILKRFKERKEMEEPKEYFPLEVLNNEEIEHCQKLSKNGYTSVVKYLFLPLHHSHLYGSTQLSRSVALVGIVPRLLHFGCVVNMR